MMMQNHTISQTSIAAYRSVQGETIARQYTLILDTFAITGPANAYQIACECGMRKEQVGRRLKELVEAGKLRETGQRAPTDTGRDAGVYELIPQP